MSCGTASDAVSKRDRQVNYAAMSTLADALRVQSGVQVIGTGNDIKVLIRGVNSSRGEQRTSVVGNATGGPTQRSTTVIQDAEPLFIIDNTVVGSSYDAAATAVNVQDIVDIKILKSYAETNAYGETGKNGVIKITTSLSANN